MLLQNLATSNIHTILILTQYWLKFLLRYAIENALELGCLHGFIERDFIADPSSFQLDGTAGNESEEYNLWLSMVFSLLHYSCGAAYCICSRYSG